MHYIENFFFNAKSVSSKHSFLLINNAIFSKIAKPVPLLQRRPGASWTSEDVSTKPGGHWQIYPSAASIQVAYGEQLCCPVAHSFITEIFLFDYLSTDNKIESEITSNKFKYSLTKLKTANLHCLHFLPGFLAKSVDISIKPGLHWHL